MFKHKRQIDLELSLVTCSSIAIVLKKILGLQGAVVNNYQRHEKKSIILIIVIGISRTEQTNKNELKLFSHWLNSQSVLLVVVVVFLNDCF